MESRVEQLIEEIGEYLDGCRFQPLSSTKIIVNKEELEDYLRELRLKTPEEIKRFQKIIANKDAILADANNKADAIVEEAKIKSLEMVTEHEITQAAYKKANEIVAQAKVQAQDILDEATEKAQGMLDNATQESNNMKEGALVYSDQLLGNVENILSRALDIYSTKYDELISGLEDSYKTVKDNRNEMNVVNNRQ